MLQDTADLMVSSWWSPSQGEARVDICNRGSTSQWQVWEAIVARFRGLTVRMLDQSACGRLRTSGCFGGCGGGGVGARVVGAGSR